MLHLSLWGFAHVLEASVGIAHPVGLILIAQALMQIDIELLLDAEKSQAVVEIPQVCVLCGLRKQFAYWRST